MKLSKRQLTVIITIIVLIVIGAAVWLFLDPIEYVLKLRDRRLETAAEEFLTASEAYYKTFFDYPWDTLTGADPDGTATQSAWLKKLVDGEIVNSRFAERSYWDRIFVSRRDGILYACFAPLSKSYKGSANAQKFQRNGATDCAESCFSCVFRNQ